MKTWLWYMQTIFHFLSFSGLIGQSWAMLFASGGLKVTLYDIEQRQVTGALENIR